MNLSKRLCQPYGSKYISLTNDFQGSSDDILFVGSMNICAQSDGNYAHILIRVGAIWNILCVIAPVAWHTISQSHVGGDIIPLMQYLLHVRTIESANCIIDC